MKLQFFHVDDLCRFIDIILEKNPHQKIFNVGNKESISVREQRNYFSFYNYEYYLDVSRQYELMSDVKPLYMGLRESFDWYTANSEKVIKKPFFDYIDKNLRNLK